MLNILLSTYNGERYLAEQLDSIIAQTYKEWRLFVRDDGSTDGTVSILKEYEKADKRISILLDGENIGACRSFERLLVHAGDSQYYAFADQDDVWFSDKLATLMQTIQEAEEETPEISIVVHSDLQVVNEKLEPIANSFWKYSNIRPNLIDGQVQYLAICNTVTGCAMIFNHQAKVESLPFSKDAYMHDAWVALMTACHGGKIIPITRPLIAYRQHGTNVLGAVHYTMFGRSRQERIYVAQISYNRAKEFVFRSKCQFVCWKIIYFIHRTMSRK